MQQCTRPAAVPVHCSLVFDTYARSVPLPMSMLRQAAVEYRGAACGADGRSMAAFGFVGSRRGALKGRLLDATAYVLRLFGPRAEHEGKGGATFGSVEHDGAAG